MGVLGISILAATVVIFCLRPPAWFSDFLRNLQQSRLGPPPQPPLIQEPEDDDQTENQASRAAQPGKSSTAMEDTTAAGDRFTLRGLAGKAETDRLENHPAAQPPVLIQLETHDEENKDEPRTADSACEEQTTPKASVVALQNDPIPQFALSAPAPSQTLSQPSSPPSNNTFSNHGPALAPTPATAARPNPPSSSEGLMAPPPRPVPSSLLRPRQPGSSTLPLPPGGGPSRPNPLPNRSPGGPSSSLFPPPTLLSKPQKPSKQIALAPGHSPLDWARLSANPAANLRGLSPDTPYLRVTPSMLKRMTGRKGKDAWTVLGGRVYNMSPYLPFHPGGEPELLRGAGRDGTKLFGEIHPWVNYEGMLSACLIGIYVPEEEADSGLGSGSGAKDRSGPEYDMEAMD